MKLQTKPYPWSCMATAFAMALDVSVAGMHAAIGHDGGRPAFPRLPEPACRRGVHIQECIRVAHNIGYSVTPIELFPVVQSNGQPPQFEIVLYGTEQANFDRFRDIVRKTRGVLEGRGRRTGHALAYDRGVVFDPDGRTYDFSFDACEARGLYPTTAWIVQKVTT